MQKFNKIDYVELNKKNAVINEAQKKLKEDFVGIDDQIDAIINNIRAWYLFPELQTTPLIINLWGLTGVGKTSLIKELVKHLHVEKDLVYFNFAQINEMSSYDIEAKIENELENETPNRIFVYDEFQYAATIDNDGEEKYEKSGLKPVWELMDTGILHKRLKYNKLRKIKNLINILHKIHSYRPIILKDGTWINYKDCLRSFKLYEIEQFHKMLNFPFHEYRETPDYADITNDMEYDYDSEAMILNSTFYVDDTVALPPDTDFILNTNILGNIVTLYLKSNYRICPNVDLIKTIKDMPFDNLLLFIEKIDEEISKGYDLTFNKSVIFVLGNLDEAYQMSFDTNPDMSPDQFNKLSKKINIVDIKQALQKRFKNEQIARLGNIHIIYPSFSSKDFKNIIDLSLNKYANEIKEKCGYILTFDKSIKRAIYNEAVFPTQGTRPIFSTIYEIVKSKFPLIINNLYNDSLIKSAQCIKYNFVKNCTNIIILDEKKDILAKYTFKEHLRLNTLRKNTKDDEQALVAVHESGHFVIFSYLNSGKTPEKLCSKCADKNIGGFLMEDYEKLNILSAKEIMNQIKITLGGYVAEKIIFGDEMLSNGASSDLRYATALASKYVRKWGMAKFNFVSTYLNDKSTTIGGDIINEGSQEYINDEIKDIINKCQTETYNILTQQQWIQMLKASAKYLSTHSSMSKMMMKKLYNSVDDKYKIPDFKNYYKNIVNNF